MPAFAFVRTDAPVAALIKSPLTAVLPAPETVRLRETLPLEFWKSTLPETVSVPESEAIRVSLSMEMGPTKVLSLLIFRRAPSLLTPPPLRVSGSAAVVMPP